MSVRRRLGEGTAVQEKNAEAAIGRVPQWAWPHGAFTVRWSAA